MLPLTGVEGGISSEPLVPLLEGAEDGVEQHVVAGLQRRVQELPGRHVVVAACPRSHQQTVSSPQRHTEELLHGSVD